MEVTRLVEKFNGFVRDNAPYKHLQVGDPYTFIMPMQAMIEDDPPRPVQVGDIISKWFDTGEPGRMFKVTKVHLRESDVAYETTYAGFQEVHVGTPPASEHA